MHAFLPLSLVLLVACGGEDSADDTSSTDTSAPIEPSDSADPSDSGGTDTSDWDNLTDEFIKYGQGFDSTGTGTDGAIYDAIGRRWYVGARKTF